MTGFGMVCTIKDHDSYPKIPLHTWSKVALRVSTLPKSTEQLIKSTNLPEDGSIHGFIGCGVHIKGSAGKFKRGSLFTLRGPG